MADTACTPKMKAAKAAPDAGPQLTKQSSDPIRIGRGRPGMANPKHYRVAMPLKGMHLSRSAPPLRYVPPKAPTQRPRMPSVDPPPLDLPPSPPMFTQVDVDRELARRAQQQQDQREQLAAAPLSRSLNDYWSSGYAAFSMPRPSFAPSFHKITEKPLEEAGSPGDFALDETASPTVKGSEESKSSYTTESTIFNMLRESQSRSPSLQRRSVGAAAQASKTAASDNRDYDGDLQFSISLNDDDPPLENESEW